MQVRTSKAIHRISADELTNRKTVALLVLVGLIAALIRFFMEISVDFLMSVRITILNTVAAVSKHTDLYATYGILLATYLCIRVFLTTLAALLCKYIAIEAAGSGLPEMKYVLSGDIGRSPDRFLSLRVLLVKVIGNISVVGAGLSVGSEGPFVQITGCITNLLLNNISYFEEIFYSATIKRQVLTAAVAVGVSTDFNAPVGGVLFAVEVTSTYFLLTNYWKVFVAAIFSSIMFDCLLAWRYVSYVRKLICI